jgi:hypothetical protein
MVLGGGRLLLRERVTPVTPYAAHLDVPLPGDKCSSSYEPLDGRAIDVSWTDSSLGPGLMDE